MPSLRLSTLGKRLSLRGSNRLYADRLASTLKEGDVVIFKGKQPHDCLIRCCTASDYNHVALVVETYCGELQLFEAGNAGVGRVPLEFYINSCWWSHMQRRFHRVIVRQLHTEQGRGKLTVTQRGELMRYQHEMLGKNFCLNPVTYMKALLHIEHEENMETSFCSQLVAGAYKRMGLLPPDHAASSYLPRDFAETPQARLPLQKGAFLGPEQRVIFERSPLLQRLSTFARSASFRIQGTDAFSDRRSSDRRSLPKSRSSGGSSSSIHSGAPAPGGERGLPTRSASAHTFAAPVQASVPGVKDDESGLHPASRRPQSIRRLLSSILIGLPAPAMTSDEAEVLLRVAMAVYRIRAWLRRRVRERRRRQEAELAAASSPTPSPSREATARADAPPIAETGVKVEIRSG